MLERHGCPTRGDDAPLRHAPELREAVKDEGTTEKARLDAFLCLLLIEEAAKVTSWRPGKDLLGDITLQGDTFATTETLGKKTPAPTGHTSVQVYPGGEYNPTRGAGADTDTPPLPTLPNPDPKPPKKTKAKAKATTSAAVKPPKFDVVEEEEEADEEEEEPPADAGADAEEPRSRWQELRNQDEGDSGDVADDSGSPGYAEASYNSGYEHAAVFASDYDEEYEEEEGEYYYGDEDE